MKKKLLFIALFVFVTFTSLAQSTTITPGVTQIRTNSVAPLFIEVKPTSNGYFDFRRGNSYSAGLMNSVSPKQLRIGIMNSHLNLGSYQDIVIDSTTRYIGFGTNNPQSRYHFYSPVGGAGARILLESYSDYPFLFFKSNNNSNQGIGWYNESGGTIGLFYHHGSNNRMYWGFGGTPKNITIDGTTDVVGIGTRTPTKANLHVYGSRVVDEVNLKIEEIASGTVGYPGLSLKQGDRGVRIYGRTSAGNSGINVLALAGSFVPVYASAFNVSSDINVKKEVVNLETEDFEAYLNQIRNIQSATYRYQWEDAETRKNSHIGFIAQTLPKEVITEMDATPDGSSDEVNLGYNLSDMIGLNVIGIKAVDAKIQKLEEIIKLQQEQIALLMAEIENIKE